MYIPTQTYLLQFSLNKCRVVIPPAPFFSQWIKKKLASIYTQHRVTSMLWCQHEGNIPTNQCWQAFRSKIILNVLPVHGELFSPLECNHTSFFFFLVSWKIHHIERDSSLEIGILFKRTCSRNVRTLVSHRPELIVLHAWERCKRGGRKGVSWRQEVKKCCRNVCIYI